MVTGVVPASEEDSMRESMVRSYGNSDSAVERRYVLFMHIAGLVVAVMTIATNASVKGQRAAKPLKLVGLGDSLSAGLGLPAHAASPPKLPTSLEAQGRELDRTTGGIGWAAGWGCAYAFGAIVIAASIDTAMCMNNP